MLAFLGRPVNIRYVPHCVYANACRRGGSGNVSCERRGEAPAKPQTDSNALPPEEQLASAIQLLHETVQASGRQILIDPDARPTTKNRWAGLASIRANARHSSCKRPTRSRGKLPLE